MNIHALFHKPNSNYCFCTKKNNVTIRLRTAVNENAEISVLHGCKYEYPKKREALKLQKLCTDGIFDWYGAEFAIDDPRLMYIFKITENNKVFYYHEEGLTSEFNFDECYLNAFQLPYAACTHTGVKWLESAVFYQIFVDRFYRACRDKSTDYINMKWGDKPLAKSFAGGDIAGVSEKLSYIRALGANALYLCPVFSSPSNHKYDTWDYETVDAMFGTNADLELLIDKAHKMDMHVCLDVVFNHSGDGFFAWQDVKKNGKASKYYDWFFVTGTEFEHFYGCKYMPKLNTENPACAAYLLSVAEKWMHEFKPDALRLDVSDEVSHSFWRAFRDKIKSINPDCAIIGENWHDAEPFLRGDQFDGIMNYAITRALRQYFVSAELNESELSGRLNSVLMRNTDIANSQMLNLIDSHDTHRFLTLCEGDLNAQRAALAIILMLPGAASLYYGTEIDMLGGYDPDCRRCFDWSAPLGETAALITKMANAKQSFTPKAKIYESGGALVIERGKAVLKIKDKRILEVSL